MPLFQVLIAEAALLVVAGLVIGRAAPAAAEPSARRTWTLDRVAVVAVVTMLGLIALRSTRFGVDTAAYVDALRTYCWPGPSNHAEGEFLVSSLILNAAMLGACDPRLLPAAWVGLVTGMALLARGALAVRVRYAALLLVSFVGVELTTNALRQGLASGAIVIAVSFIGSRPLIALTAAVVSIALHSSSGLVIGCLGLALLPWRYFWPAIVGLSVALALSATRAVELAIAFVPLERLLFEIGKYLASEADETLVRVLAFGTLAAALAGPMLAGRPGSLRELLRRPSYGVALRLAIATVPSLAVPYFGYRLVYGVFPVVLWLVTSAVHEGPPELEDGAFVWTMSLASVLLAAWAGGSSFMRSVPFLG